MKNLSRRFRQSLSNSSRRARQRQSTRRLRAEQLEGRLLLAGDVFATHMSPATNAQNVFDGNGDGAVSPLDVLLAINYLNDHGSTSVAAMGEDPVTKSMKIDYNADGYISPADPLVVINKLAEGEGTTSIVVSTVTLDKDLVVAAAFINGTSIQLLGGGDWGDIMANDQILLSNAGRGNGFYTVSSVSGASLTLATSTGLSNSAGTFAVGKVITEVSTGEEFLLGIVGEDVQAVPGGPFAVYNDIMFDSDLVTAVSLDTTDESSSDPTTPNFRFNGFTNNKTGNITGTPGVVDEAGAFRGFDAGLGAGPHLVYTVNMRAGDTAADDVALVLDPADDLPAHDILLNGQNDNQCTAEHMAQSRACNGMVMFVNGSIDIVEAAADITARADTGTVDENGGPIFINVLANDSITTGTGPTITTPIPTTSANGGTVAQAQVGGVNGFNYTPAPNFSGQDTFNYTITNGSTTASAMVTVTVNPIDNRPVITGPNSISTNEDTIVTLSGFSITDPDSTSITVTLTANGTLSQTTFSGTPAQVTTTLNSITYTPIANSNAADTLTINASDGGLTGTKTVNITINPVNDAPVNVITGLGTPPTVAVANTETHTFASNTFQVTDADANDTLTVTVSVQNGTLTSGANTGASLTFTGKSPVNVGTLIYDPIDSFTGTDTLTISSTDGTATDTDTVAITVAPPQFPFAAADVYTVNEGTGSFVLSPSPLANDLRDPGATLTVTAVTPTGAATATRGNLTFAGGNFTYTPPTDANFFGTDTFTYTIQQDPAPSSTGDTFDSGTISIVIRPVNDAPVNTVPGPRTVNEDATLAFTGASLVSIQDVDAGNGSVTVTLTATNGKINVTAGAGVSNNGSKSVSISGSVTQVNTALAGLTYAPDANFSGSDQLTINTNDNGNTGGGALTDIDTVNITISPINDAPTIVVPGPQTSFFTGTDNLLSSIPNPIRITDIDAGNNNVQVDLTIADGTVSLVNSAGATVTQNPGGSNGIRVTGSVASINTALANGVTYRSSTPGNKTLTATVNDLGNTGSGGPLTATATIAVQVLDFVPVNITGRVFMDDDGDGQADPSESAVGGVKVTLSGTDFQGNAFSAMATTDASGNYTFSAVRPSLPGSPYTVTREASSFFVPGSSSQARIDLDASGNIQVRSGSLNFALGGFVPEFAEVWRLFALSEQSPNDSGILFGLQGTQRFSIFAGDGWDVSRFGNARFVPGADGNSGILTVFDAQAGQDRSVNVSTVDGTLTYRGVGADRVYRIIGGSSLLGALSVNAESESQGDATTDGAAFARGVDALFAGGGL